MRTFTKLAPEIWQSARFGKLCAETKLLLLYLMTNNHQNSSGCYRLPEGYACVDLGGWPVDKYRKAIRELKAVGLIIIDEQTSEILIDKWFQHNPPMNSKHFIGTKRMLSKIQSGLLRTEASIALQEAWDSRNLPIHSDLQDNDPRPARSLGLLNTPHMRRAREI